MSDQPQLKLHYDANRTLTSATCSKCGVELWMQAPHPITEDAFEHFFRLHLQARHQQGGSDLEPSPNRV
jgi:hypothetical protein